VVRYQVTPEGMDWISQNKEVLNIKKEKSTYQSRRMANVINDDDIPF
jgi:hypothetical protein